MDTRTPILHAVAAALAVVLAGAVLSVPPLEAADSAHSLYTRALARERQLRNGSNATVAQLRAAVRAYEAVVRRFPRSGYSDNALWQGGNLAVLAFERSGDVADRRTAQRLLNQLVKGYPASSLVSRVPEVLKQLDAPRPGPVAKRAAAPPPARGASAPSAPAVPPAPAARSAERSVAVEPAAAPEPAPAEARPTAAPTVAEEPAADGLVTVRDIRRTTLPDGVRVSIEMDGEAVYHSERLENPRRLFFDLKSTRTVVSLQDAVIRSSDDIVREIRLGRHPGHTTRVVIDLQSVEDYSVFTLYNPFRLVVDFRRAGVAARQVERALAPSSRQAPPLRTDAAPAAAAAVVSEPVPQVARPVPPALVTPTPPAANTNGQFSIARQLGLGVSRIVLDAGHGGHDPGARANGVSEAELVLDVTLRLRDLLLKEPGFEVTLTRDRDVFVPLEERTAIANREGADLFLSIHANASRNLNARGIETYFLNFASNREAEAVAARENSASGRTMHNLPEIVRAIALNNKIDESRDFATMVQQSVVRRLAARNRDIRDLGVKQAPFVVLIGASMPSILAEISFVSHKQEAALLKTPVYRQQIAESLLEGILRYQRSLKGVRAVASRE